jgi:hypothetical protein
MLPPLNRLTKYPIPIPNIRRLNMVFLLRNHSDRVDKWFPSHRVDRSE